jgi:glutathione S-transferase
MKLYDAPMAPNPRRVRMFLLEKGVEIPVVNVNLMKGEHRSKEYRNMAANGRVPALELDDGSVLVESMAICRYLEHVYPEPNLMGVDGREIAEIDMWVRRLEFELMMPCAGAFRHLHPAGAALEGQIKEFGESMKDAGQKRFARLDKELADKKYMAGDRFTVADISAICTIQFADSVSRIHILDDQSNLKRWYADVSSRPSVAASLESAS